MIEKNIVGFGEILWDVFPESECLGGAPFNVCAHFAQLPEARSQLISAVGHDERGKRALQRADEFGVGTRFILQSDERETGVVDVQLSREGEPTYSIREGVAWDAISVQHIDWIVLQQEPVDVFCFGTLAQRTEGNRILLKRLIQELPVKSIFYDVNLRQQYFERAWIEESLRMSYIVKVNEAECAVLAPLLFAREMPWREFAVRLRDAFKIEIVIVTRGASGVGVFAEEQVVEQAALPVEVVDTVGGGDSFSAGFLYGYLAGMGLEGAVTLAIRLAGYVVGESGAVPEHSKVLVEDMLAICSEYGGQNT